MTRIELTADWLEAELTRAEASSDPGRFWYELVAALRTTGIWPPGTPDSRLRVNLSMAMRECRDRGLVIYRQGWEYRLAVGAGQRHEAVDWLIRMGPAAVRRLHNVIDYANSVATVTGGYAHSDGPALWTATTAQTRAAEATLVLAYDRSFN